MIAPWKFLSRTFDCDQGARPGENALTIMPAEKIHPIEIGHHFDYWTVIAPFVKQKRASGIGTHRMHPCRCVCGKEALINENSLVNKFTKSCGCMKPFLTHKKQFQTSPYNRIKIGDTFGRLTVVGQRFAFQTKTSNRTQWYFPCLCQCGNPHDVQACHLLSGRTRSCGCILKEIVRQRSLYPGETASQSNDRLYKIWSGMKARCECETNFGFPWYGGRGIKLCAEWRSNYLIFKNWSLANGYKSNLSIDRLDTDKDYCPDNCQWISRSENSRRVNKRTLTAFGETKSISDWARDERCNVTLQGLCARMNRGMDTEEAITLPTATRDEVTGRYVIPKR